MPSPRSHVSQESVAQMEPPLPPAQDGPLIAKARGKTDFLYDAVVERIEAQMAQGVVPWRKGWIDNRNVTTDASYRGINQLMLGVSGRESAYWATFKQFSELGGVLKKGEGANYQQILYWKFFDGRDLRGRGAKPEQQDPHNEGEGESARRRPLLLYYRVYNLDQVEWPEGVDGLSPRVRDRVTKAHTALAGDASGDMLLARIMASVAVKPEIRQSLEGSAFFSPEHDIIVTPPRGAYTSDPARYYSVLFHELIHWTGPRLGRKQVGFTEHAQGEVYSREELVAEMGAAFLCQEAGMFDRTEAMNASYIKGWSGFIRNDPKALVVAAGAAQKAVDYLLGRSFEQKSAEPTAEGGA